MFMYSIYDSKAERYLPPFLQHNDQAAVREVTKACMDPNHDFHRFGGDFTLFELGIWDERRGVVLNHEAHVNLGNLATFQSYQTALDNEQVDNPVELMQATKTTLSEIREAIREQERG